jgi:hypothetical protein
VSELPEVWVESRSGGLHREPFIVTADGFLAFHAGNPQGPDGFAAELVLFERNGTTAFPAIALARMVGADGFDDSSVSMGPRGERAIPGQGGASSMSVSFGVYLLRRIPEPTHSAGSERHRSRLKGADVFTAPQHPNDARETAGATLGG